MPENHNDLHDFGVLNPETHHEESDVDVRGILWFVVIFVAFAIVTHIFLYFLYAGFQKHFRGDIQPKRTAISVPPQAPQTPRLQPFPQKDQRGSAIPPYSSTPVVDMVEMHATEEEALKNPGWIDKQKGIVRIPIDRAKEIVVQRGGKL
jgi:ABC-type lipoprotein release transport system permease subunit